MNSDEFIDDYIDFFSRRIKYFVFTIEKPLERTKMKFLRTLKQLSSTFKNVSKLKEENNENSNTYNSHQNIAIFNNYSTILKASLFKYLIFK